MALSPTIDIFEYRRDILNNSYLPKIYLMKNEAINEMSAGVKRKMFQTTTNK